MKLKENVIIIIKYNTPKQMGETRREQEGERRR